MGVRKNAKFLSAAEKERFVKACVFMKNDIVDSATQLSKWDQYVGIHLMIQDAFAPGHGTVNFGHSCYSFLSWHRYFLYQFEKDLQGYVHVPGTPDLMLPYWDWTDPASLMTDTFLGPTGDSAHNNRIKSGYFAFYKPGDGPASEHNPTPLPGWWPSTLPGWRLPSMFPSNFQGGLRRHIGASSALPPPADINTTLNRSTYPDFQHVLETGDASTSTGMHGAIHGWVGGSGTGGATSCDTMNAGHMSCNKVSSFDPIFYLHHCNVDRLWAMWQMDGHQNEYPTAGGSNVFFRDSPMYPWVGALAGYGTNTPIIPMPDFSALGTKTNASTLDFRTAFGYTYDTIPIIGIGLDRTGSMSEMTPDPMTTGAPDVTKWEAAKRGVAAFLHDCAVAQNSKAMYVMAGIKTFRTLAANDFTQVFGSPGYGLIKTGSSFSEATFNSNVAAMTPGGNTPLADALVNVHNTLTEALFGGVPADEQRYLAMLTDGILTSGSPMSSIGDHSMSRTAIFAMGFGTGLEVDYATIASIVAKGRTLTTQQVFHGENAGTIDKFFSNALAKAIGFTSIYDPVLELFEGEYTHISFSATSADDALYLTAQGMDFDDDNWSFMLHGPNGQMFYGDGEGDMMGSNQPHSGMGMGMCNDCCQTPYITSSRSNGRLTMFIQRGSADKACWVGYWSLMISYKVKRWSNMMMVELGGLLFPVAAGPVKGERYAKLLKRPALRTPTRNVPFRSLHDLDVRPVSTNSFDKPACNIVVNIYARTTLETYLSIDKQIIKQGEELAIKVNNDMVTGNVRNQSGFARLISPAFDLNDIISKERAMEIIKANERLDNRSPKEDFALLLARYEREKHGIEFIRDQEVKVVSHDGSPLHIHYKDTLVKGTYHVGVIVEGLYYPNEEQKMDDGHDHQHMNAMHEMGDMQGDPMPASDFEAFSRVLNISFHVE